MNNQGVEGEKKLTANDNEIMRWEGREIVLMNKYARALWIMGWVTLIFGVTGSFILGDDFRVGYYEFNWGLFFVGLLGSVISGLFLMGFSEVIRLLDENHKQLKELAEKAPYSNEINAVSNKHEDISDELPDL